MQDPHPTINKAELQAIIELFMIIAETQPVKCFVDSNMFFLNYENVMAHWLIAKLLPDWMDLCNKEFCTHFQNRTHITIFEKVPSHMKIDGNDQEDVLAKLAIGL